jgi:glycosyl transferase family 25
MPQHPLNSFFDKIYVLTLARLTDRQNKTSDELQSIDFEWFYGLDKATTGLDALVLSGIYNMEKAKHNHRYSKAMTLGMVCCAVGHRMIYADMLQKGLDKVLIFEDDVVLATDQSKLQAALDTAPADWELLYFGYEKNETSGAFGAIKQGWYHVLHRLGFLKWQHSTINNLYAKPYSKHWWRAGYHDCTHAYAITKAAAAKLLSLQTPVGFTPDNLLAFACTTGLLKGYAVVPKLFNQFTAFQDANLSLTGD